MNRSKEFAAVAALAILPFTAQAADMPLTEAEKVRNSLEATDCIIDHAKSTLTEHFAQAEKQGINNPDILIGMSQEAMIVAVEECIKEQIGAQAADMPIVSEMLENKSYIDVGALLSRIEEQNRFIARYLDKPSYNQTISERFDTEITPLVTEALKKLEDRQVPRQPASGMKP